MAENMRPLGDKVLVKLLENNTQTAGGIIIPDAAKEKTQRGKVIAAGTGKLTQDGRVLPMAVKAGDTVFFGKYAGTEVSQDYLIIREDEILAIVE